MWKNYFKISFRNLQKRKLYTAINLLGLVIALVSFLAIALYIYHEWSYDRMYTDHSRIYRFNQEFKFGGEAQLASMTPSSLIPTILDEIPEAETGTLVFDLSIFSSVLVDLGQGSQEEKKFAFVDERFLEVFDFQVLAGQKERMFSEPNLIVLTESTANRLFGSPQNAEGKSLKVDGKDYLVSGVIVDFPSNSHLDFDFLASFKTHRHGKEPAWSPSNYYSYVKLREGADPGALEAKLDQLVLKYLGAEFQENGFSFSFFLLPVTKIHLGDQSLSSIKPGTNIKYLYIFGLVAILLLAIGIINYVNLATAESTERNKEVGLRKSLGAGRAQLFGQFISESLLLTISAALLSLLVLGLLFPELNKLIGVPLPLDLVFTPVGIVLLLGLVLGVGVLAGFYPAVVLSGMEPIQALANQIKVGGGAWLRKTLVVFQFFVSMGLLIATLVVNQQLQYMQQVNLGYEKDRVIALNYHYSMRNSIETLKQEFSRSGAAQSSGIASSLPIHIKAGYSIFPGGDAQKEFAITGYAVDQDALPTLGINLISGKGFVETDYSRGKAFQDSVEMPILLNESALKELAWTPEEAIGRKINFAGSPSVIQGIVSNFYFNSLHHEVGPLAIFLEQDEANTILVKLSEGDLNPLLASMEASWKKVYPDRPFAFQFVDQAYQQLYQSEQNVGLVFGIFSSISVLVALMGLLGLVSYVALRRTREIGIRKVLGATEANVFWVLAKDFLKLLGLSAVLAIVFGIWFSKAWLESFANQASVGWSPYILSVAIVLVLAAVTIGYRGWKVYRLKPSQTLKTE
ncbi:MAG: ABC transporter permease [Cyclobacteriaceae bacterium]|nr:ABC transporter permease [Cyclobacteriaceae bacterium]MDX5465312.1 ABC transporter permease [Cyclobacteriaceae bacterium]